MRDYLVRGTVKNRGIRVFACTTTQLLEKARQMHDLWPTSAAALGRMMSAVLMMASMEKNNAKMTVTINGGGPIGTMLCVTNGDGKIKGFVAEPHCMYSNSQTGKLAVGYAVGNQGYLQVIKDMGLKEPFVSQVQLLTGEIGDDFSEYFYTSEQTGSAVSVGVLVNDDNTILASGGFIVQLLPDATEDDIKYIEYALNGFPPVSSLVHEGLSPEDILLKLMSDVEILGSQDLDFECGCSKDNFARALMTLGKQEIQDMIETDGKCDITCQFCNTPYHFEKEELEELLSQM